MSVFKLHVAIAALQKMENECIAPDSLRFIESLQIHKDTYSPLRELYPERNFYLSYADLMRYAVSQSDNNACDILIDYLGGYRYRERPNRQIRYHKLQSHRNRRNHALSHIQLL